MFHQYYAVSSALEKHKNSKQSVRSTDIIPGSTKLRNTTSSFHYQWLCKLTAVVQQLYTNLIHITS